MRLDLMESLKTLPFGAVWDRCRARLEVAADLERRQEVVDCKAKVTGRREEGRG